MTADSPLDSYSRTVAGVAAELTPRVVSLRVRHSGGRHRGEGLGGVSPHGDHPAHARRPRPLEPMARPPVRPPSVRPMT